MTVVARPELQVPDDEIFVVDNGGRVLVSWIRGSLWKTTDGLEQDTRSMTAAKAMSPFRLGSMRATVTA